MIERLLRRFVPYKEIGWTEIGEQFTRFQLIKSAWFNLYLHRLWSPNPHPQCHDHPWAFYTLILKGGYCEYRGDAQKWYHRSPGTFLYRPAEWRHNVTTCGKVCWSLVLTGPKVREWGFTEAC